MRKADVGKTLDEGLAQARQLQKQGFVLLLDEFVLLLDVLQAFLHGRDLPDRRELLPGVSSGEQAGHARWAVSCPSRRGQRGRSPATVRVRSALVPGWRGGHDDLS